MFDGVFGFVLGIIFLTVVVPKILKLITAWRLRENAAAAAWSGEDRAVLEATAARLEQRVAMLERILDAEAPDWRRKAS
jgi:phage shock protein B